MIAYMYRCEHFAGEQLVAHRACQERERERVGGDLLEGARGQLDRDGVRDRVQSARRQHELGVHVASVPARLQLELELELNSTVPESGEAHQARRQPRAQRAHQALHPDRPEQREPRAHRLLHVPGGLSPPRQPQSNPLGHQERHLLSPSSL